MKKRPNFIIFSLIAAIILIDIYAFNGLKYLTDYLSNIYLVSGIHLFYFAFTAFIISGIAYLTYNFKSHYAPTYLKWVTRMSAIVLLTQVPKIFFVFFYGIGDIASFMVASANNLPIFHFDTGFLVESTQILTTTGIAAAMIPFFTISYGIIKGRYNYKTMRETLKFTKLPPAFDGFKIVHISDMHLGSFHGKQGEVKKAIKKINKLKPDVIFFTGDIVNNYARELEGWETLIGSLQAKYGKYSVLGNHDYGDYGDWNSAEEKRKNLDAIKQFHQETGFNLLLNEHTTLEIAGQKIDILGVENWGYPPFKQYGDLDKTMESTTDASFKILLSHDPSHWDAKVLKDTGIDLTLSGHTHGAQFGLGIGKKKWSPIKKKYPRWAGLYRQGEQYLYVNRGFGFHAFPGRVGMPPEITCIELKS